MAALFCRSTCECTAIIDVRERHVELK